jgi:SAM-dependent methyltransferase
MPLLNGILLSCKNLKVYIYTEICYNIMVTHIRYIADIGMGVIKDVSMKQLLLLIIAILATMPVSMVVAENAEEIVRKTGIKGGLIIHLGCGNGELTTSLKQNDRFFVHGLDTDKNKIEEARKRLLSDGLYGDVSLMHLTEDKLPYVDNLVNLLVVEEPGNISKEEMMRVLTPLGVLYIKEKGKWTRIVKPWPKEIDEWTHFLHNPQNNAVCKDELIGQPRSLRWVGYPRWARSHEEVASMSAMVSAQGKVFYIVDNAPLMSLRFPSTWKVVARDAFNGKKLWEKSVSTWLDKERTFRTGPVHLPRRLVAVEDRVFVTLGLDAPVSMRCFHWRTPESIRRHRVDGRDCLRSQQTFSYGRFLRKQTLRRRTFCARRAENDGYAFFESFRY